MSNSKKPQSGRPGTRGAFINGIWHCDCEPRLPAEKFQTKNGGKNHGRWFFTCQRSQPKRCPFFLWSDDAKVREESAVINNSRTEPIVPPVQPKTPKKQTKLFEPRTPLSNPRSATLSQDTPKKQLWSAAEFEDHKDESFNWSSSGDEELASVAEAVVRNEEDSPRKAARTPLFGSPGKRKYTDMSKSIEDDSRESLSSNVLFTPNTSTKTSELPSPFDTDTRLLRHDTVSDLPSSLATDVLQLLKGMSLTSQIEKDLVELLNRHDLKTQGIARGRDITRLAVQAKDKKIAELQARITELEIEKETSRTVIAHLKQDIATSPKRPSRPRFGSRSEI